MTEDETRAVAIDKAIHLLGEYFESVQILASWVSPDGCTNRIFQGTGNWYSRQGMADAFIRKDKSQDLAREIAHELDPPDDESWKNQT